MLFRFTTLALVGDIALVHIAPKVLINVNFTWKGSTGWNTSVNSAVGEVSFSMDYFWGCSSNLYGLDSLLTFDVTDFKPLHEYHCPASLCHDYRIGGGLLLTKNGLLHKSGFPNRWVGVNHLHKSAGTLFERRCGFYRLVRSR